MQPGATVSQKDGKTWSVGPKGGTYFSDMASKQLDKNMEQEEWWAVRMLGIIGLYNKGVDENNTEAQKGITPEKPKRLGWWF